MRERNKRNIVIGILCVMVVFMSVGYAILSQNLNINGTANITGSWDIYIDSITFNNTESSSTTSGTGEVDATDKTKASYSANLLKPQDEVIYDVVVANNGTIDAILDDITLTPVDNEYFKFETIGIEKGEELNAKTGNTPTTKSFKIKITFKDSVTEANMPASGTKVDGLVKLDYVQEGVKFETGDLPGGDDQISVESSPFKVTKDGVLINYQRQGNETSVKVPAEVNGIKIKAISAYAFIDNVDVLAFLNEGYAVGVNSEKYQEMKDLADLYGMQFITIEEYIENPPFAYEFSVGVMYQTLVDNPQVPTYLAPGLTENYYLASIDLSEAIYLEEIGKSAFVGYYGGTSFGNDLVCQNGENGCGLGPLTTVIFPTNGVLHTIGDEAFAANQLTNVVFPDSLITIGESAFSYNRLTTLKFPNNLETIRNYAFEKNKMVGTLIIPASIKTIEDHAFVGNNLSKLVIKRTDSTGISIPPMNYGYSEVIYDPNYVE